MKNRLFTEARQESGIILITCMIVLLMLSLIGVASIITSNTEMDIANNESISTAALYLADAGLERSISVLSDSMNWRSGFNDEHLGKGTYSVSLTDSTTSPFLGDKIIVRSTGKVGEVIRIVEAYVRPVSASLFNYGAFGRDNVRFGGNGIMDSYDSDIGDYSSQESGGYAGSNGHIGSLGSVTLDGSVQIYGDAETSSPGDIHIGGRVTVHGDTSSAANPPDSPLVTQAQLDYARNNTNAPGGLTLDGNNADYDARNHSLDIGSHSTVTFTSGVYYFSDVKIRSHGELIVPENEQVVIYVSGNWDSAGGTISNEDGVPSSFQVYLAGDDVKIAGGSSFYGAIYAPCADVKVTGGGDFYGAVVGQTINNGRGTHCHYDEALSRDILGIFSHFDLEAWTEI